MIKECNIISGGEYSSLKNINKELFTVACDKGLSYCEKDGIVPNLFVGDNDSYLKNVPSNIKVLELPKEKDDTDTLAAIKYVLNEGYNSINIYCALGGRLDHLLGNIQIGMYAVKNNAKIKIIDENNILNFISNDRITINKNNDFSISVLSLTDECKNVSIAGAKYSLNNYHMVNTFPIGISNEFIEDITISVEDGILLIIQSRK